MISGQNFLDFRRLLKVYVDYKDSIKWIDFFECFSEDVEEQGKGAKEDEREVQKVYDRPLRGRFVEQVHAWNRSSTVGFCDGISK